MRRFAMLQYFVVLLAAGAALPATTGCATVRESIGNVAHSTSWRLHDETYRPWNDVNSGSLPPVAPCLMYDPYFNGFLDNQQGRLVRY